MTLGGRIPGLPTIGAALVSGVALWLASEPIGAGWLAWSAIVPVACVVLAPTPPPGARWAVAGAYLVWLELSLVPDLPPGIAEGQWGDPVLPLVADSPGPVVAVVVVPLFALALGVLGFGRPWLADRLPSPAAEVAAIAVPAVMWTALEVVEVRGAPAGWWTTVSTTQEGSVAARPATLGGLHVLTFAIAAVNYAVALALVRRTAATVAAAGLVAGGVALAAALAPVRDGDGRARLVAAAVQPGYDTAEDVPTTRAFRRGDHEQAAADIIDDLTPLTRRAADAGARLVVWPEAVFFLDPAEHDDVRARLARLAREIEAAIVVSTFVPGEARSIVRIVRADGTLTPPQPKQRPMWYLGERGRGAGPARSIAAAGTRVGTLPGVDNEDPAVARRLVADGARVLASMTHDWRELAVHQRTFASLDALSTGTPVVRADWRYGSGIWAADGRLVADAGIGRARTVITADVRVGRPTPYARAPTDVAADAALVAALLLGGLAALARLPRTGARRRVTDGHGSR